MYTRGAKPNTIMLAIIKSQPTKAFMLSSKTRNFSSTDTAKNYFAHIISESNPTSESAKLFKQIFKAKGGWDGFTFRMKEYQDIHSADKAFRRFKTEYEMQNIPKNCFKTKVTHEIPTNNRPPKSQIVQSEAPSAPVVHHLHNGASDESLIAAVLAGRVVVFGEVKFRLKMEAVEEGSRNG